MDPEREKEINGEPVESASQKKLRGKALSDFRGRFKVQRIQKRITERRKAIDLGGGKTSNFDLTAYLCDRCGGTGVIGINIQTGNLQPCKCSAEESDLTGQNTRGIKGMGVQDRRGIPPWILTVPT